jgi:phosphoribosylamine--glycine ligase
MKVLLIGNGGRESALAWKISQSKLVEKLYIAPGNPGTKAFGENINIKADDIDSLKKFAIDNKIDLTVVGPEVALVLGIVDEFNKENLRIFGPSKEAANLEGSKACAKQFMVKHGIPTAKYGEYTDYNTAVGDLPSFGLPVVIKADGLAAGKGVIIAETAEEARKAVEEILLEGKFGDSGNSIVVEEFLKGIEASMICFVDGKAILPMEAAQDYKKALDQDLGLNTGGMGAYSPSVLFNEKIKEIVDRKVLQPFINGVKKDNLSFKGMIFIGLMIEGEDVKVLEFNVRFGDPETQVLLPRLKNDIIEIFEAAIDQKLSEINLSWTNKKCVTVVLASGGYPEEFQIGFEIKGLDSVNNSDVIVFHAGTKDENQKIITSGGRVLNVTALADSLEECRSKVYQAIEKIDYAGKYYRNDIALM